MVYSRSCVLSLAVVHLPKQLNTFVVIRSKTNTNSIRKHHRKIYRIAQLSIHQFHMGKAAIEMMRSKAPKSGKMQVHSIHRSSDFKININIRIQDANHVIC